MIIPETIQILTVFLVLCIFGTIWYHKQYKKKEHEADFFRGHYLDLRRYGLDEAISDTEKYDIYKKYKYLILGKPHSKQ